MDFDEEEYQTKSTSDYWADVVKGTESFDENEDEDESQESKLQVFVCKSCGFMYDLSNPPKNLLPFNYYIANEDPLTIKCPNCHKKVPFQLATKEEYEKYLEKKKQKEDKNKEKQEEKIKDKKVSQAKEDIQELVEDLKDRLLNNEISPKRFVNIFYDMSFRIYDRYGIRKLDLDTTLTDFRKGILDISDSIVKEYDSQQDSERILEEYDENIQEDELYKAELEYYIEDNQFSIPDYELRQRIKEYDEQEAKIRNDEYKKEIEEKYQKRKNELLQKAEERKRRQKLRDIM